jgi:predicted AlkP superfamily phosphohydrolase/phosphomutase
MSGTKELITQGSFLKMSSSIPEVSCVAWSSIITGKNPGEHGIFGFTDLEPGNYKLKFPLYTDLKAKPFWETLEDKRSIIINVPATYPVREMNGVHISGFVSVDINKSVYPPALIPKLKQFDYRLDVDSEKAHESIDLFLEDLEETLQARIRTYRCLWENYDWDIFMLVFTGTDRLMHFLWDAYEDENHKYHGDFLKHFQKIDEVISEIRNRMSEEDVLIMLSDHGFEKLESDVYINYLLRKEGFLKFKNTELTYENIDSTTKAFALDPARIYINLKGKYPQGCVEEHDREKVIEDLGELFTSLTVNGKKVIRKVYRKEEIYSGPYVKDGPDLILLAERGFNLKASPKAQNLTGKGIFTGKHSQDNAFLLLRENESPQHLEETFLTDLFDIITA